MMKKFISAILVLVMIVCSLSSFAAYEIDYESFEQNPLLKEIIKSAAREKNKDASLMYPPDEHPYIYVNPEYIEMLKASKDNAVYKQAYSYQLNLATKDLPAAQPEGGILNSSISNQLVARAFMYTMGEVDKAHAKATVEYAIEYIKNARTKETYVINIYKDLGSNGIQCGALVYDWCYNAMTSGQREELAAAVKAMIESSDQPCRPDNVNTTAWGDLNGKAVGQPIIYNSIAVTALYDQYPEMYETVMKKIQGSMAEASKIYGEAGALTDGSIAYTREYYTYYVELLFQRMGHDISDKYGKQLPAGYKMLYSRLPYGGHLKHGDDFDQANYKYGNYLNTSDAKYVMGLLQVMFEDPYLKHYYQRENNSASAILELLLYKSNHEAATPDDLPLAYETYEPRSEIMHKTSWQEGYDSPQVTAYMNMNNRRSGDHDHCEHGSFQLYYKGPLTISQGNYFGEGWGGDHWRNYLTRSVSKNTMLVYDPSEIYVYGSTTAQSNDGGQRGAGSKTGGYVISQLEEHFADDNLRTKTISSYIGPQEKTPAFSYIKGDLTKAYSKNKMAGYQRSMVFMDTFNETYPGIMVVYDRVSSTKAEFPKTWLLQAVAEPTVSGNKITIDNSKVEPLANGKLVNQVLLPEKFSIDVVGGIDKYIVDGNEYPVGKDLTSSEIFRSGYRAEVKPASANKEDVFLNAMFVADADTTAPDLEFTKIEDNNFIGVYALDRQVMFSKSGNFISNGFSVKVENSKDSTVLLTDIAPGKWTISGDGVMQTTQVKEGDNCIVFTGKAGKVYQVNAASEEAEISSGNWPDMPKEKIGDFAVKIGAEYQYLRQPTKLVDGVPYLPESFVKYNVDGTSYVREGNKLIITCPDDSIITLTAGSSEIAIKQNTAIATNTIKTTDYPPFIDENGVFYFNHSGGIGVALGLNCTYVSAAKALITTVKPVSKPSSSDVAASSGALEGVDESKVLWPVTIYASSDDGNVPGNLVDRDLSTRWSSLMGDEEWAAFEMGEEAVEMSAVQIAFYNGDKRNWKFDIEISDDGEKWTKVLKGMRSAGKSKEVETFKLPEGTKARFIRYLGHGEEVTASFYNSVTQFIIIK